MKAKYSKMITFALMLMMVTVSFSVLSTGQGDEFTPPVGGDDAEAYKDKAKNASANGAATFLKVEGYNPWAALVVNAGDPRGVDMVTAEFTGDTLYLNATDGNETNHATILVNKEFADKYLGDSEGDLEINTTAAVNHKGMQNSNTTAGGNAVYVFQIDHFSTQTIEMSSQIPDNDFEPPVDNEKAQAYTKRAENAAAHGAVTFLRVEGYQPWAALVINAGDPLGVDAVNATFEDDTLKIKVQDSNSTNHVTILINKKFADEHLAESEGDLNIETSDAVNYDGMNNTNESAGGNAVYVFQVEHFSTQTIDISAADKETPFPGLPLVMLAAAVPVAYYAYKKKKR